MSAGRISPIAPPGSLLKTMRLAKHGRRPKRERNGGHLAAVRLLPCLCCDNDPCGEAAHVRMGGGGAMGLKPSDHLVVGLCHECHMRQHRIGEIRFWGALAINPHKVASQLFLVTGDIEAMRNVVFAERERRK